MSRETEIFDAAVDRPTTDHATILDRECFGDPALRARVEDLLAGYAEAERVLPAALVVRADPAPDGKPRERIGRYHLIERIGEGGFGSVWLAEQETPVRRRVALKIIKVGMDTQAVIARFEVERQALALMDHPNIAKVHDAGATETGRPYFVMELVLGVPITRYCRDQDLPASARLRLFIDVCLAIQHAHQKGIVHRDIKPSNILVTEQDGAAIPKVIDFGVAKAIEGRLTDKTVHTELHQFIGTPAYMSPEQAQLGGVDIDTRSDIYSLGVLLYELLTGQPPFDPKELVASGLDAMRKTIREQEPVRPSTRLGKSLVTTVDAGSTPPGASSAMADPKMGGGAGAADLPRRSGAESRATSRWLLQTKETIALLRGDLDWIVMKCLEKDRTRRYETANGLAADLRRHLNHEPVVARPPSTVYRVQKLFRRNKIAVSAAALFLGLLLIGAVTSTWLAVRATRAERQQIRYRHEADSARANETQVRKLAQLQAYAADMKAAQVALQQNSRQQAVDLLEQYWPKPGEADLRGVEWRYLWREAQGDEVHTWIHPGIVMGARFSPNGRHFTTACSDGFLRIWDFASRRRVAQFQRNITDDTVRVSFCYAPDGRSIASTSREGIVLIDSENARVLRTLELPPVEQLLFNMAVAYSPNGQWLVAVSGRGTRVWNTATWESFTLPVASHARAVFAPDGKTFFVGSSFWDVVARKETAALRGREYLFGFAFSPTGESGVGAFGSVDDRGRLGIWDAKSGGLVRVDQAHNSRIFDAAFSHDGKRFASCGSDQQIHVWDAASQKKTRTLRGHLNEVWSLAFSPDDRYLLTSGKDRTVKLWDLQAPPAINRWTLDESEWPVGFTTDGKGLITVVGRGEDPAKSRGGVLRHWEESRVTKTLPVSGELRRSHFALSAKSGGFHHGSTNGIPGITESEFQVHDAATGKFVRGYKVAEGIERIYAVSPDGRWLAGMPMGKAGLPSGEEGLCIWDAATGERIAFMEERHRAISYDIAVFSPDSRWVALATGQYEVKLWEIATRRFVRTFRPHSWRIYAIRFSADGRHLASSSFEGDARIFEVETGKEIAGSFYGHGTGVYCLSFSADGRTLVTAGGDSTVRFWHIPTGREMLRFENTPNRLSRVPFLSPTDELLVWGHSETSERVRVERIPSVAEIDQVRARRMNQNLPEAK